MSDQSEPLVLSEEERQIVLSYRAGMEAGSKFREKRLPEMTPAMQALCDRTKCRVENLMRKLAHDRPPADVYAIAIGATAAGMELHDVAVNCPVAADVQR